MQGLLKVVLGNARLALFVDCAGGIVQIIRRGGLCKLVNDFQVALAQKLFDTRVDAMKPNLTLHCHINVFFVFFFVCRCLGGINALNDFHDFHVRMPNGVGKLQMLVGGKDNRKLGLCFDGGKQLVETPGTRQGLGVVPW